MRIEELGKQEILSGPMGWGEEFQSIEQKLDAEKRIYEHNVENMPISYRAREELTILPEIQAKWEKFQADKGYGPGSNNLTLLDEFVFGEYLGFPPQIIGSCVISNTITGIKRRQMFELAFLGEGEEYFGTKKNGPNCIAPYGPFSYGAARKRGNMSRGDGLYCQAAAESFLTDGFLLCSSPELLKVLQKAGYARDQDFPEPQSESLYRAFGSWQYIDELKPFADFKLTESSKIKDIDDILAAGKAFKPIFQCSGIAIKKDTTHKDGFTIYTRDRLNSWSHNMGIHGFIISSDNETFPLVSNESWGPKIIYPIRADEVAGWYEQGRCDAQTIGEMDLPKSTPKI